MATRFWKNDDGKRWIEIDGVGWMPMFDTYTFYSRFPKELDCGELPKDGKIECDANWQPLKPVVREWIRDYERWHWDGEEMRYTDGTEDMRKTCETPRLLDAATRWESNQALEVHPGTRIPINQPLPSSEPPENDLAEPSRLSVDYLSGKIDSVAERASDLASRIENIEDELNSMSDRIQDVDYKIDTHWQFRELRQMASKFNERLDALESAKPGHPWGPTWEPGYSVPLHYSTSMHERERLASLAAENVRLKAEAEALRKERDELLACVDRKPDVPDVPGDPYPRTYHKLSGHEDWYVTFDRQGQDGQSYTLTGGVGSYWTESEMLVMRAVRCPDPRKDAK